jgi:hypothetical protein
MIRPGPLPEWAKALIPKRSASLSLPLLDPLQRFGARNNSAKSDAMPSIILLGCDPISQLFRQPEPLPPPKPSPDDPLDAAHVYRRLDAIGRALDDLPGQAQRMARWQARTNAARERTRQLETVAAPNDGHGVSGATAEDTAKNLQGDPTSPQGKCIRRFGRSSPMRPGISPEWFKHSSHAVHQILDEVPGLAVWARDGP